MIHLEITAIKKKSIQGPLLIKNQISSTGTLLLTWFSYKTDFYLTWVFFSPKTVLIFCLIL